MPPKKASVQVLLLTQKAEVKEVSLNTAPNGSISGAMLQALLKKKAEPELIGTYKNRALTLFLFGYTTGKAGSENKHEFPPPHDSTLCFGDIIMLASKDAKSWLNPVPLKSSDYEAFYTRAFGGFEDLDSDEEEEAEAEPEPEAEAEPEAEVEEEEDEEEGELEVEGEEAEEAEEEAPVPRVLKKKARRAPTAAAVAAGAAQVYSSYLYVPAEQELVPDDYSAPYNLDTLAAPRQTIHKSIVNLFADLLTSEEINMFERCIYNGAVNSAIQRHVGKSWSHPPFVELYSRYAKHIAANFHPKSYVGNTELFDRYKAGEITFKDISAMDTYQLFEGRWMESFAQQQVREKRQLEGNKAMATDRFLCMRCHKRECTYYELQTRSADEPMTIFITCLNCGKHWRQ
jgi:DNA-directed RNA polymerase subunit M/transcription elongation factor TFIIS